jgi:hypothetical protein
MLIQTEAQIYLANKRGKTRTQGFSSFHTFNFGSYYADERTPFGRLAAFNDETLAPEEMIEIAMVKPTEVILVPIVGGIELMDRTGESVYISCGETFSFLAFPESKFKIINPYDKETVNYLQIHFWPQFGDSEFIIDHLDELPLRQFSLETKNELVKAFETADGEVVGFIGQFEGREEGTLNLQNPEKGVFGYVIQGAFEVQNRLLEKGDALSLKNVHEVEFEALSNGAIILLVEVG